MARQRRLNEAGTYHHITARGVNRSAVFLDDQDRRQFLALLSEAHQRFGCRIVAFCLMTNHIHITMRDDDGKLSKTLHWLNGVYAKRFNLRHDRTGHLFERRFWSSMLDSDAYLTTCAAYVHRNPVEAGMVENPEDYRWSSYPSYLGLRSTPQFLDTGLLLDYYGGDIAQLHAHTGEVLGQAGVASQLRAQNPPMLLSEDPTKQATASSLPARTIVDARPEVSLATTLEACAAVAGVTLEQLETGTPGRRDHARGLAAYVAHRHAGHSLSDIASKLGLRSTAAVSMLHRRFAASLDDETKRMLREALERLGLGGPDLLTR